VFSPAGHILDLCEFWTTLLTYLLHGAESILFEKLTGSQLVKKVPAFYGTRRL